MDGQRKHVVVYNPSVVFYLVNLAVALSYIKFKQLYKRAAKRLALPYMYVFLADDIEQFLYAVLHQIGLAQEQARKDVEFSVWLIYESRDAEFFEQVVDEARRSIYRFFGSLVSDKFGSKDVIVHLLYQKRQSFLIKVSFVYAANIKEFGQFEQVGTVFPYGLQRYFFV